MNENFESFKHYLGVDRETTTTIRCLQPVLNDGLEKIVRGFYSRMREHPDAMSKFPGGEVQIARQELALRGWLINLIADAGLAKSSKAQMRIGAVHMAASINEELIVASMNWLRHEIADVIRSAGTLPGSCTAADGVDAINKLLDYNLGLILTSYWRFLQDRVMRADRLIQIGQYTASINHELRNPLGVIGTSAYLLRASLGDSIAPKAEMHLDKIDRNLERAQSIIAGLLRLLRVEQPKREKIKVGDFLSEQLENLTIPDGIEVEIFRADQTNGHSSFDPTQVGQVIENLVQNSIDASGKDEGRIQIKYEVDSDGLVIHIRDNGSGIDPNLTHQIFDPLFSTKSFGTGLGLTLAKAIIESHGGSFELCEGIDDKGVGFEIRMPHHLDSI
ncbi:MAG: two-component system sensor histidine kinase HydH [Planctomycetota bacterium]|jgi:two-component system sensor histidine kinase HydH